MDSALFLRHFSTRHLFAPWGSKGICILAERLKGILRAKSEKKLLKMSVIDTLKNCGYDTYPAPLQKDDKPDSWHKFEKTATI